MRMKIKVFRADKDHESCLRYIDGHRKVLEAYGVTHVTSVNVDWMYEPYTYIVLVESKEDERVLGGGRVQIADGKIPLPIETAIDDLDPRIFDMVREKALQGGTGEYCGLWNSKEVAGLGIGSIILVRTGIALLEQLKLGSLFAFCSPATVRISNRVGYSIIHSLGVNGTFYYPKEDLLATALLLEDPLQLSHANPVDRDRIMDLRRRPVQLVEERGPKGIVEVEYDLRVADPPEINTRAFASAPHRIST